MAALTALASASVIAAQYLVLPALVFVLWKNVASPLTIAILSAAFAGLAYTSLVKPGEELSMAEKAGVLVFGAAAGGFLQRNRFKIGGGM